MEFRILGPLEVLDGGRPIELPRAKQRALLAALLLRCGEAVSADRLIERLWGPAPPRAAKGALQNLVSQLRQALGPDVIVTRPAGYALAARPEEVDLARFERLVAESRGAGAEERAARLREALSLWRGPPLADVEYEPFAQPEIGRLEEMREAAREDLIEAKLELGHHADLVGELEALVAEHPFRERLRGQLMLALYRSGRQAEALDAYQDARRALIDGLGIDPGVPLRELEQAILRQDPSLRLAPVSEAPRRKTVTALLADISCVQRQPRGGLDPERMREAAGGALQEVRAAVKFHGGQIVARAGDEALGIFGVPSAHEDDALRAIRAAVDARTAVEALSDTLEQTRRLRVELRTGIATGDALVEQGEATGEVVAEAKRLARRAGAGEIRLASLAHELAASAIEVEDADGDVHVLGLVGGASGLRRRLETPLVGRVDELGALRGAFERALRGRRSEIMAVVGEAGIGKTRLVKEFVASIAEGAAVLTGRCVSYGEGATLLPVAEMIEQAVGEDPRSRALALLAGEEDADVLARRIGSVTGREEGPASIEEAQWAVRRLFGALARRDPLVLVFEDVQWGEPALLDLIEQLGRIDTAPILVLAVARSELLEKRPKLEKLSVLVGPLSATDTAGLILALGTEVPTEARRRVVEIAAGNPLYVEQLVAYIDEDGELEAVPPSIEALLESRLDLLDPGERTLLQRAGVAGVEFWRGSLVALSSAEDVGALGPHLLALGRKGLIEPARSTIPGEDSFRFQHVLVRDAAYRGLPTSVRADLHERFADWLADRRGSSDEIVGYHLEQAFRYGAEAGVDGHVRRIGAEAGTRLAAAGIRAWKRGDASATVNLLGRAVSLLPERDALRREAMCELGIALRSAGHVDDSVGVLLAAVDASVAAGDRRLELRARIELAAMRHFAEPEGRADELLEAASSAIPTFEALDDHRSLGRAWLLSGFIYGGLRGHNVAWAQAAENAAHHYRASGWSSSTSLGELASALYNGPTPATEAVRRCELLVQEPELERGGRATILAMLGGLEAMLGRFERGRDRISEARTIYDELGREAELRTNCNWIAGDLELLAGDAEAAAERYAAACEFVRQMGHHMYLATLSADLADALYVQGEFTAADRWARVAEADAATHDVSALFSWRGIRAKLMARDGRVAEAESLARQALRLAAETDCLNRHAKIALDLADVLRLGDRSKEASTYVDEAVSLFARKGNVVAVDRVRSLKANLAIA